MLAWEFYCRGFKECSFYIKIWIFLSCSRVIHQEIDQLIDILFLLLISNVQEILNSGCTFPLNSWYDIFRSLHELHTFELDEDVQYKNRHSPHRTALFLQKSVYISDCAGLFPYAPWKPIKTRVQIYHLNKKPKLWNYMAF